MEHGHSLVNGDYASEVSKMFPNGMESLLVGGKASVRRTWSCRCVLGLSLNRQSIFDSLGNTLSRSGDVEEVYPDPTTGHYQLIESILSIATVSSTGPTSVSMVTSTSIPSTMHAINQSTNMPILDHLYHREQITRISIIRPVEITSRSPLLQWFHNQSKRFGARTLIISSLIATCFLLFLLFVIVRLHCTNRSSRRASRLSRYNDSNGKNYAQLNQQSKRYSLAPSDGRMSKKRVPKLLRYLHTNEDKPSSFRLTKNSTDSYHLISSLQDGRSLPYRNSDCVLNEHCCIHSSLSQPVPASSSIYHQVNRLMLSGSDPPLPLPHLTQSHVPASNGTLRSVKKDLDNSSAQTYSAVYSCDLAANLDIDQEFRHKRASVKRRSILKNTHSTVLHTKILFLYVKTLVDCYAIQPKIKNNTQPILLALADENRIQLFHAFVSNTINHLSMLLTVTTHLRTF